MKPSRRAVRGLLALLLFGILSACAVGLLELGLFTYLWSGSACALALLYLLDLFLILRMPTPELTRQMPRTLPVGLESEVQLSLFNPGQRALNLQIWDIHPPTTSQRGLPLQLRLPPRSHALAPYRITPHERGYAHFQPAQALIHSPFGLWFRSVRIGQAENVAVYPDFAAIAKFAQFDTSHQLSRLGVHKQRRRGEGREFHQLREYVQGDPLRSIDWKASSRLNKLISREYQDERDQKLIFMLDCGQSMRAKDGHISHFDQALNAMLLMAHVALQKGDEVGLFTFAGLDRRLAPRKGHAQLRALLNQTFDLQPTTAAADFNSAASLLLSGQNKRALVVIISNLREEDCRELAEAALQLRRRHLVLIAGMREQVLETSIARPVEELADALILASAHDYLQHRANALERLRREGCFAIDCAPQDLPVALVNVYLEIKQLGAL